MFIIIYLLFAYILSQNSKLHCFVWCPAKFIICNTCHNENVAFVVLTAWMCWTSAWHAWRASWMRTGVSTWTRCSARAPTTTSCTAWGLACPTTVCDRRRKLLSVSKTVCFTFFCFFLKWSVDKHCISLSHFCVLVKDSPTLSSIP